MAGFSSEIRYLHSRQRSYQNCLTKVPDHRGASSVCLSFVSDARPAKCGTVHNIRFFARQIDRPCWAWKKRDMRQRGFTKGRRSLRMPREWYYPARKIAKCRGATYAPFFISRFQNGSSCAYYRGSRGGHDGQAMQDSSFSQPAAVRLTDSY